MNHYLQTDQRWANVRIGTTSDLMKNYGCFITSLAMLDGRTPAEVNNILTKYGGLSGSLILSEKSSQILGLEYQGKFYTKPNFTCIAETNYYDKLNTSYKEQHFFVIEANGNRLDPLGSPHVNEYKIVSYRYFKSKENQMNFHDQFETDVANQPWCEIFAGDHDPEHRYAFFDLYGRFNYDGKKVQTLHSKNLAIKTISPRILIQQLQDRMIDIANLQKQITELTTKYNTFVQNSAKDCQTKIDAAIKLKDDKITTLETRLEVLTKQIQDNTELNDEDKKVIDALKVLSIYLKKE